MNLSIVSIARPGQSSYHGQTVTSELGFDYANFYKHTDNWVDIDTQAHSLREKLQYRADRRNEAVKITLEKWPETTDLMMLDSFYIGETRALIELIETYRKLESPACLGPAIWARLRTTISQVFHSETRFYDAWATPELRWCPYGWRPEKDVLTSQEIMPVKGFYKVSSIGGCYLFPRSIWDKGTRFSVPEDLHGCEHNGFHASHNLPKYIDFNTEMFRVKAYSLAKCVRCSIGNWQRTR